MKRHLHTRKASVVLMLILSMLLSVLPVRAAATSVSEDLYSNVQVAAAPGFGTTGHGNSFISPRSIELKYQTGENAKYNGYLITTAEYGVAQELGNHPGVLQNIFPIYVSADGGRTWDRNKAAKGAVDDTTFADIVDQNPDNWNGKNGGMLNCPQLYELPAALGDLPAGTIVCAGDVGAADLSWSAMDFYASTDAGHTWQFMSQLAPGGANSRNQMGYDPVWEPFFLYDDGTHEDNSHPETPQLICYYSDETDPDHNQKLVFRTTEDGRTWSEPHDLIAFEEEGQRPGMPIVAEMADGRYIMVYETVGFAPLVSNYRISLSQDPQAWDPKDVGKTFAASGSPYVTVMTDGTIVANTSVSGNIYVNTELDASGEWLTFSAPVGRAYNRQLMELENGDLYIVQATGHGHNNPIYCGTTRVPRMGGTAYTISSVSGGEDLVTLGHDSRVVKPGCPVGKWGKGNETGLNYNWILKPVEENRYQIINQRSGFLLTAQKQNAESYYAIQDRAYSEENANLQIWTVEDAESSGKTLKNAAAGMYLSADTVGSGNDPLQLTLSQTASAWTVAEVTKAQPETVTIQVDADEGAEVHCGDGSVLKGTAYQCITVEATKGYVVTDVKINSVSVGAVRNYVLRNINKNVTIQVSTESVNSEQQRKTVLLREPNSARYVCMAQNTIREDAKLIVWALENQNGFRWIMEPVDGAENQYRFVSSNSGNVVMDVLDNTLVQKARDNNSNSQKWIVVKQENGAVTIQNVGNSKYLTKGTGQDGTPVLADASEEHAGQLWYIERGLYLDANGGTVSPSYIAVTDGATIQNLPTPTREGMRFVGWFDSELETAAQVKNGDPATQTLHLYARWERITSAEKTARTCTVTIGSWTYGEDASEPTVTLSAEEDSENITYIYKLRDAEDSTYSSTVPSDAGEYTVKAVVEETENYQSCEATYDFEIFKKQINAVEPVVTAPVVGAAPQNTVESGDGYTASITWNPADEVFQYGKSYTAVVTLTPDGNHKFDDTSAVSGWEASYDAETGTLTLTKTFPQTEQDTVETPVIDPNGGYFYGSQTVTITCATDGAEIYYTTDGTTPTTSSTRYDGAFTIRKTLTVKAIAVKDGYHDSAVAEATLTRRTSSHVSGTATLPQKAKTLKFNTTDRISYVNGYPDGTVKPEGNVTRAEVAAILCRMMDAGCAKMYETTSCSFSDVSRSDWFNGYVATLENANVIVDTRAGAAFRPNEAITRAELAAMLAQFADTRSARSTFNDVSARHWAADEIAVCAELGWINGYPDGTFRPDQTVTRAEMMAMINRALGRSPKSASDLPSGMKTWSDNADTGKWYYLDVQEATNSHT